MATHVFTTPAPRRETLSAAPDIGRRRLMSSCAGAAFAASVLAIATPTRATPRPNQDDVTCRDHEEVELLLFYRRLDPEKQQALLSLMRTLAWGAYA